MNTTIVTLWYRRTTRKEHEHGKARKVITGNVQKYFFYHYFLLVDLNVLAYIHLKFKHTLLGTQRSIWDDCLGEWVYIFVLVVNKRDENVVVLNLPIGPFQTRSRMEPVPRCEPKAAFCEVQKHSILQIIFHSFPISCFCWVQFLLRTVHLNSTQWKKKPW